MRLSKEIAIGVLASTLSLSGLALGVTGCASKQANKPTTAEKGAEGTTEGTEGDKGALASCGAGSCG